MSFRVSHDLIAKVRNAAAQSDLVQAVCSIRPDGGRAFALGEVPLRPLYEEEIGHLERLGNSCANWSRLRVADGFDWRRVRNCAFQGDVLLGRSNRDVRLAEGVELPAGLSNATVCNCV